MNEFLTIFDGFSAGSLKPKRGLFVYNADSWPRRSGFLLFSLGFASLCRYIVINEMRPDYPERPFGHSHPAPRPIPILRLSMVSFYSMSFHTDNRHHASPHLPLTAKLAPGYHVNSRDSDIRRAISTICRQTTL